MKTDLKHLIARAQKGEQNKLKRLAVARLLGRAKTGIYDIRRALTREEAHEKGCLNTFGSRETF